MNYCMPVTNFSSFPWKKLTLNIMLYFWMGEKSLSQCLPYQYNAESFIDGF